MPTGTQTLATATDRWLALAGEELDESRDRGASWSTYTLPEIPELPWLIGARPRGPSYHDVVILPTGDALACAWDRLVRFATDRTMAVVARQDRARVRDPHEMLVSLRPVSPTEVLVLSNPFGLYRFRLGHNALDRWDDGLPPADEGIWGVLEVTQVGETFFAGTLPDLFRRGPADLAWTPDSRGGTAHLAARALAASPWDHAALLAATYRGSILSIAPDGTVTELWREREPLLLVNRLLTLDEALYVSVVRGTAEGAGLVLRDRGKNVTKIVLPPN